MNTCPLCGGQLEKVWFKELEYDKKHVLTGRWREAVDYLQCNNCGKRQIVDGSMDLPWTRSIFVDNSQ